MALSPYFVTVQNYCDFFFVPELTLVTYVFLACDRKFESPIVNSTQYFLHLKHGMEKLFSSRLIFVLNEEYCFMIRYEKKAKRMSNFE